MKKKVLCVVILAMLFLCVGCVDKGTEVVNIGYFNNITHAQALLMKSEKTLEQQLGSDVEVKWTAFNAGPAEMEAIFAGEIDLGYIGPVPALSANVKSNGDVKIISNTTNAGAVLLIRKDSGIKSVKDLAGKKVAVPQLGNTQHLCLLNLLSENGLKTTDQGGDVTINASSNADILNLMDNGSVDAALVPEPWGTTIENNGSSEVLLDYNEVFLGGEYPTAVVVASQDFIDEHPDIVADFLKAHEEATLYINENAEESQKIVNTEIESTTGKALDEEVIKSAFNRMKVSETLSNDAIMKFAEISKNEGFINKVPEEDDVFKTKFD